MVREYSMLFGYSDVVCEKFIVPLIVMLCAGSCNIFVKPLFGSSNRHMHMQYFSCWNAFLVQVSP